MIGVATEPPAFFEIPALKRVAPVAPVTVAAAPGGTPPSDAAIARAYAPEHAPAERDDSAQEQEQLRALLSELLQIHAQEPSAAAQSAAAAINWGGRVVSDGLLGMAELGTAGLEAALGKFKVTVEPKPTPTTVGPKTEARANRLKGAAGTTEAVTDGVCSSINKAATAVGRRVAGAAREVPATEPPSQSRAGIKAVGAASLGAAGEVLSAAEDACKQVVASMSATTSGAIGHRYGDDAESLAQTSLAAVQSAAHTALNVVSLGPKAVAKSSAVAAAKSGAATAAERDNHGTHAPACQPRGEEQHSGAIA